MSNVEQPITVSRSSLRFWSLILTLPSVFLLSATVTHAATLSGTLYTDEGTTEYTTGGADIVIKVDGLGTYSTTTLSGSGDWYIDSVTVATSSVITVWIDDDPTFRTALVTIASSTADITDLDLYRNRVILRSEDPTVPLTNMLIGTYDKSDDSDIPFITSTTTATGIRAYIQDAGMKLYVWPDTTFAPAGHVILQGNGAASPDGDLFVGASSTLRFSSQLTMAGSLAVHNTARVTGYLDQTITFTATTSGKTISGNLTATNTLPNLTFDGVGGSWTFSHNASTTGFTIATGTVIAPAQLTISGDYHNSGTFTHNNGTVYFDKDGRSATVTGDLTGASAFNEMEVITSEDGEFGSNQFLLLESGNNVDSTLIHEDYLYATVRGTGSIRNIKRYNLSDLSFVDQSADFSGEISSLLIHEGYLYGAGGNGFLRYDLSDFTAAPLASASAGGFVIPMVISGDYIYVAGEQTVKRYSLADITAAPLTGAAYGSHVYSLVVEGEYLYVGGWGGAIKRYNLSDITATPLSVDYGSRIDSLVIHDGYLYAGGGNGEIKRYEISNITAEPVTSSFHPGYVASMVIQDGFLYAAGVYSDVVLRYDLSDFGALPDTSNNFLGEGVDTILINGDYLYASGWLPTSVRRYNLNDFRPLSTVIPSPLKDINAIAIEDDYLYAAGWNFGSDHTVFRFDLNDPTAEPLESASYGGANGIWRTIIHEAHLYAVGGSTFKRYILADLTVPPVESASYGGDIQDIGISGGYIYVGGSIGSSPYTSSTIKRYNLSDITATPEAASVNFGADILSLVVDHEGEYLYVGGANSGIKRYALTDLNAAPLEVGTANLVDVFELIINEGYLYAGGQANDGAAYINRYDLSNFTTAPLASAPYGDSNESYGMIHSLVIHEGYIYAGGYNGVWNGNVTVARYSLDDITAEPSFAITGYDVNWIYDMAVHNNHLYFGGYNYSSTYNIYRHDLSTQILIDDTLRTTDVVIAPSSTLAITPPVTTGPGAGKAKGLEIASSMVNNNGKFKANNATTTLVGNNHTLTGTTTFHHLVKEATGNATTTIGAGNTITTTGKLTFKAPPGQVKKVQSSVPGQQLKLETKGPRDIAQVALKDVKNLGRGICTASRFAVTPLCIDSGNNDNAFGQTPGFAGILYTDNGLTPDTTGGRTITLDVGGEEQYATTTVAGTGAWIIEAEVALGSVVTIWVDEDPLFRGTLTTIATTTGDTTNLPLYQDHIILYSNGSTTATITNDTLRTYDQRQNDAIPYRVSDGGVYQQDLGFDLYLFDHSIFRPVTTLVLPSESDLILGTSSTLVLDRTVTLPGNLTVFDGVTIDQLATGTNAFFFTATSSKTITGHLTGSSTLPHVTFNGAGGEWTFTNNASTSDFTIASGTVIAPPALTITGNYTNHDTIFFTPTDRLYLAVPTATTTQTLTGVLTGTSSLPQVTLLGIGTTTFANNASTTALTIQADTTLVAPTTLSIGNTLENHGTFLPGAGTVVLTGPEHTLTGTTTFFNLQKIATTSATTTFEAGALFTILGTWTKIGIPSDYHKLRSSVPGEYWYVDPQGQRELLHVDLKDMYNLNPRGLCGVNSSGSSAFCTDSGNNINWSFLLAQLSGMLYADAGVTEDTVGNRTIVMKTDGGFFTYSTTTDSGTGAWSLDADIATSSVITVWVDGDPTFRAALVTIASSTNDITTLDLYRDHVILRSEDPDTNLTNRHLALYSKEDDTDIPFVATTSEYAFTPADPIVISDFESGSLTPLITYGDAPWSITSGTANSGTYSAQSGSTAGVSSGTLEIEVQGEAISFAVKTSSEWVDRLLFFVDDVVVSEWSGESDWRTVGPFALPTATSTLRWEYRKTNGAPAGANRVWIDDITLLDGAWLSKDSLTLKYIQDPNITLSVADNTRFKPNGPVILTGSGAASGDGDLILGENTTLIMDERVTLAGSLTTAESSAFVYHVPRVNTFVFTATTTGKTITATQPLPNLIFDGSGGEWTFTTNASTTGFRIDQGTVIAPAHLTIAGDYHNDGTFTHNNGTVYFEKDGRSAFVTGNLSGDSAFYRTEIITSPDGAFASSTVAEYAEYGAAINAVVIDGDYIYAGGQSVNRVRRFDRHTLEFLNEADVYGGIINTLAVDDSYVYAGGRTDRTVKRYDKSTLAYIDQTENYGGDINQIVIFDDLLYVGGATTRRVRVYDTDTMSFVGETPDYGGTINTFVVDEDHIYVGGVGGNGNKRIRRYDRYTLELLDQSPTVASDIKKIFIDEEVIYLTQNNGVEAESYIARFDKNSLSFLDSRSLFGFSPTFVVAVDDIYIYVTDGEDRVYRLRRGSLQYVDEFLVDGSMTFTDGLLLVDDNYLYVPGYSGRIYRYPKADSFDLISTEQYPFSVPSPVYNLATDDEHVYATHYQVGMITITGGFGTRVYDGYSAIRRYHKETLEVVGETMTPGVLPWALTVSEDSIYVFDGETDRLNRYDKESLELIVQTGALDEWTAQILIDGDHIFLPLHNSTVVKMDKYTLEQVAETNYVEFSGQNFHRLAVDEDYVYVTGEWNQGVTVYDKQTLEFVSSIDLAPLDFSAFTLTLDGDSLYVAVYDDIAGYIFLRRYNRETLAFIDSTESWSSDNGGQVYQILYDEEYLYVVGEKWDDDEVNVVTRYRKSDLSYAGDSRNSYTTAAIDVSTLYLSSGRGVVRHDLSTQILIDDTLRTTDVVIAPSSTLAITPPVTTGPGAGKAKGLEIASSMVNNNGKFKANNATTTLVGNNHTLTGTTTFHHLVKEATGNATTTIGAGNTITTTGKLTFKAPPGQVKKVQSSVPGQQLKLETKGPRDIAQVALKDVKNLGRGICTASRFAVTPLCIDSGNNDNAFGQTPGFAGILYTDNGLTPDTTGGRTITLDVGGEEQYATTTVAGTGAWIIEAEVALGSVVTIWVDEDPLFRGTLTTIATTTGDTTNLPLYQDHIILYSNGSTTATITNDTLRTYDQRQNDAIPYRVSDGGVYQQDSGFALALWYGTTWQPTGPLRLPAQGIGAFDGDLYLATTSTLIINDDVTIGGSLTFGEDVTLTELATTTFTFTATTTSKTITGHLTGSTTLPNVTFAGAGGEWTFTNNASTSDFTIASGTVIAPPALTVTGNYTNHDTIFFTPTDRLYLAVPTATTTQTLTGVLTGTSSLPQVTLLGIGTTTFANNASTTALTIQADTTLVAPTTLSIGNTLENHGTFLPGAGTVILTGPEHTLTGTTTFFNLQKIATTSATTTFEAGALFTILGTWTKIGIPSDYHKLRSSVPGEYWYVDPQDKSEFMYVDIQDMYNLGERGVCGVGSSGAALCIDSGNNFNWSFLLAQLLGTLYTDAGLTEDTTGGRTITLAIDGSFLTYSTTTDSGTGAWSLDADIATSSVITVWVDGDPAFSAALVTIATSTNNLPTLALYKDHLILQGDHATGTLTNAHLALADQRRSDSLPFTVTATTFEQSPGHILYLAPYTHFNPGGPVILHGNGQSSPDGDLVLGASSTLTVASTVTLAGDLTIANGATVAQTDPSNAFIFTATTSGKTLGGTLTGSSTLPNVTFAGAGGEWTFTNNASTTNFTIATGTVVASPALTVSGDYHNSGTFTHNSGTVYFEKDGPSATLQGDMVEGNAFHNVIVNTSQAGDFRGIPSITQTINYGGDIRALAMDDNYIYAAGATTNRVNRYNRHTLEYIDQTNVTYGGAIYAILVDDNHIYAAGATTLRVHRYNKHTMAYIDQSDSYGNTIWALAQDDNYVYAGGAGTSPNRVVRAYDKTNLSNNIGATPDYGGIIYAIAVDDGFIYAGGATNLRVRRYNKETFAYLNQTNVTVGTIYAILVDNEYVYAAGTNQTIRRHNRETMNFIDQSDSYGGNIWALGMDDTHIYAGGATTNEVRQYRRDTLAFTDAAPSYSGIIYALKVDDQYLYAGGATTRTVRRDEKRLLQSPLQSPSYAGDIRALAMDDNYIYAAGATTNRVNRYNRHTLEYIDQTNVTYGGAIYAILVDDNHIYAAGATTLRVHRYNKHTMAYIDQSDSYGNTIWALAQDDNYVYAGGAGTSPNRVVRAYDKTNLSNNIGATPDYGGIIYAIAVDDNYIYAGGATTLTVRRYNKSTYAYVDQTATYGGIIYTIAIDDGYLYAGGATTLRVRRYNKHTMAYVDQTDSYGGTIWSIIVDDDHVYAGGATTNRVNRYTKDLAFVDRSPSSGGIIYALAINDLSLYFGGATLQRVRQVATKTTLTPQAPWQIDQGLTITHRGTLVVTTATTTLGNTLENHGTFLPGAGTVILTGPEHTLTGTTTFFNLQKIATTSATTTFEAGALFTILGTWTKIGIPSDYHKLRSSVPGEYWYVDPQDKSEFMYVDIQDMYNLGERGVCGVGSSGAALCIDSGNNVNWSFLLAQLLGTLYTDAGLTEDTTGGRTITLAIDGSFLTYSTTTDSGTGAWSLDADIATSSVITVWVDGDPAFSAALVTIATSTNNLPTLALYKDHLILQGDHATGTLTNAHLALADQRRSDSLPFTVTATTLEQSPGHILYLAPYTHFNPGGPVILHGNGQSSPDGDLVLGASSTLTVASTVTLAGDLTIANGATVAQTDPSNAFIFTATTSGKTLGGTLTGSSTLPNVTFAGAGGEWTFTNNASTTNFTIATGTVVAPAELTISGDYENRGEFNAGAGTIILDGPEHTLRGTTTFHHLTKEAIGAATTTFEAGATVTFTGTWTMTGPDSDNLHKLRSTETGEYWYVDPQADTTLEYVDIQDAYNLSMTTLECDTYCLNSGNNIGWSFETLQGTGNGSSTIADHTAGQVGNAFNFMNKSNEALFAFNLTPETGTSTVTTLTITLAGVDKLDPERFSNIRLLKDYNNNGRYDGTDEAVGGAGSMTIDPLTRRGTLTFSAPFLATTTTNYLIVADWDYPENGVMATFSLLPGGVIATDESGTQAILGGVKAIQHHRNAWGAGGGSRAAIRDPRPPSRGVVTGGTNEGGERIGEEPGFRWPTAHSGDWLNAENAYDQVDGTYATANTENASSSFSDHGFTIAGNSQITGIAVRLEVSAPEAGGTIGVQLSYDGGTSWTTTKETPTLTTTDTVVTLGGTGDTWGRSWIPADFSNTNFRVRLIANPSSNTVQVDALQVRIYHQTTGGGQGGGGRI
jgi:hypothetical protein